MPRSNQMNRNPKERPTESTEVKWIFLHSGKCEGIILHLYLLKPSLKGQHGRIAHNEDLKIKPLPGELESQAAGPLSKALCPHQPSSSDRLLTEWVAAGDAQNCRVKLLISPFPDSVFPPLGPSLPFLVSLLSLLSCPRVQQPVFVQVPPPDLTKD